MKIFNNLKNPALAGFFCKVINEEDGKMNDTEKVQILKDLIAINSVNGNELEVAQYLQKLLEKHDIESKLDKFGDNRANLVAELGNKDSKNILGITVSI